MRLLAAAVAAGILAGCSGRREEPLDLAPIFAQGALKTAGAEVPGPSAANEFAFDLARALVPEETTANVLFSPLSIRATLAMLATGTKGETQRQLLELLGANSAAASDAESAAVLQALLNSRDVDFSIANSVWSFGDFGMDQGYVKRLAESHGAMAATLPSRGADGLARVNDWTKTNTRGRIPRILDRLSRDSMLVLVNAVAFDAAWIAEFDPDKTKPAGFEKAGGGASTVQMMSGEGEEYLTGMLEDGANLGGVPYQGKQFQLVLVLPPQNESAVSYLGKLDSRQFEEILRNLRGGPHTELSFPKVKLQESYNLETALREMGVAAAFEPSGDFSPAVPSVELANVSQAIHKAFIEWDERGTKAAAATAVEVEAASAGFRFYADRPFLLFLVHMPTKWIVMMGVVNDP